MTTQNPTQLQRTLAQSFARGIVNAATLQQKRVLALMIRSLDKTSRQLVAVYAFALATAQMTASTWKN